MGVQGLPSRLVKAPKQSNDWAREPLSSFPPLTEEYPEDEFREAAAIWKNLSVEQRRIWNEAGRPDLLTYPGLGFVEWIIDNADDAFDFDGFVEEVVLEDPQDAGQESPGLEPLLASSWVVALGFCAGLLVTYFSEESRSFTIFVLNYTSTTAGLGIVLLVAFAIARVVVPNKQQWLRHQMVGLAGWVGLSVAVTVVVFLFALAAGV